MKVFAIRDSDTLKPTPALYPCETCPPTTIIRPIWEPPVDIEVGS